MNGREWEKNMQITYMKTNLHNKQQTDYYINSKCGQVKQTHVYIKKSLSIIKGRTSKANTSHKQIQQYACTFTHTYSHIHTLTQKHSSRLVHEYTHACTNTSILPFLFLSYSYPLSHQDGFKRHSTQNTGSESSHHLYKRVEERK